MVHERGDVRHAVIGIGALALLMLLSAPNLPAASASTHTQAAERLFSLLPVAQVVRTIYGDTVEYPRPSSDLFYKTYRETLVAELQANYSEAELLEVIEEASVSEDAAEAFLQSLQQSVSLAVFRAVEALQQAKPGPGEIHVVKDPEGDDASP